MHLFGRIYCILCSLRLFKPWCTHMYIYNMIVYYYIYIYCSWICLSCRFFMCFATMLLWGASLPRNIRFRCCHSQLASLWWAPHALLGVRLWVTTTSKGLDWVLPSNRNICHFSPRLHHCNNCQIDGKQPESQSLFDWQYKVISQSVDDRTDAERGASLAEGNRNPQMAGEGVRRHLGF